MTREYCIKVAQLKGFDFEAACKLTSYMVATNIEISDEKGGLIMCNYCDFSKGHKIGSNLIGSGRGEAVVVQSNKLLAIKLMAPNGCCLKGVQINYCPMCGRKL